MGYRVHSHRSWHRWWKGLAQEFGGLNGFMLSLMVSVSIGVLGARIKTFIPALGPRPESHLGSLRQFGGRPHWPELASRASAAQLALIQRLVDRLDQMDSQNRVAAPRRSASRAAYRRPKPYHRAPVFSLDLTSEIDRGLDEEEPTGSSSDATLYMPGGSALSLQ